MGINVEFAESWRSYPTLARPSSPEVRGPTAPPAEVFRPADLAEFMALRLTGSIGNIVGEPATQVHAPPSISRPTTPPMQVFAIGPAARQLLYESQAKAWNAAQIKESSTAVANNIRTVMARLDARHASLGTMTYAVSSAEAIQEVLGQTAGLINDNKVIATAIGAVADIGHSLARSLEGTASISPQFGAAAELVEVLAQLRSLYGGVQAKFGYLQSSVETLSTAVLELQERSLHDKDIIRTIAANCSDVVEPMLKSLHYHLKQEIDTVRETIGPLQSTVSALESGHVPSAEDTRRLRELAQAAVPAESLAHDVGIQSEPGGTVGCSALGEDLSATLEDIRQRVAALEASNSLEPLAADTCLPPDLASDGRTPTTPTALSIVSPTAPTTPMGSAIVSHTDVAGTTEDLSAAVAELSTRMDRLEASRSAPNPEEFEAQVQQYLNSIGLSPPLLAVLIQLLGAHMPSTPAD